MLRGNNNPREILKKIYPFIRFPGDNNNVADLLSFHFLNELLGRPDREKIPNLNNFSDAVELLKNSKNVLVLTGAGVSVSCGIPDFRSVNGIYARLHKDFPELPNPQSMFDIHFFKENPLPFYNFAREIFPGQFKPSLSHMFIKFLESNGQLLRNYTQNIDTLERIAGVEKIIECHGSFARSTCLQCSNEIDSAEINDDVMAKKIAYCKKCKTGVLKPNIVFFGEDLHDDFYSTIEKDASNIDLLLVIGSSLQVHPVASIPHNIDQDIPQILINREELQNYHADIKLLGDCDNILFMLSMALGGSMQKWMLEEINRRKLLGENIPQQYFESGELSDFKAEIPLTISEEEFKEMVNQPFSKRPRLIEDYMENKEENEYNEWRMNCNYIPVESKLPSANSLVFIKPNISLFKGASYFYDLDQNIFVPQIRTKHYVEGYDSDSDSRYTDESIYRSKSEQPATNIRNEQKSNQELKNQGPVRSYSCPSFEFNSDDNKNTK